MWEGIFQVIACLAFITATGLCGFWLGAEFQKKVNDSKTIDVGYCVVRRDVSGGAVPVTKDGAFVISHDYESCLEVAKKYGDRAEVVLCNLIED